jgi:hypothetical protein
MKEVKGALFILIFFQCAAFISAQVIDHPNSAMKSPETLVINRIETTNAKTIVYLTLENRIKDGYFCADKRIYIIYPDGSRSKLIKAAGIPTCPEMHKFKEAGEKLDFTLVFPALKKDVQWIDIVEECSAGCLFFYGLTLDLELNKKLDELFQNAAKTTPGESIALFKSMIDETDSKNPGIEGLLYINIIIASVEAGDKPGASVWYKRLLASGVPRASYYVKFLNDKGIRF